MSAPPPAFLSSAALARLPTSPLSQLLTPPRPVPASDLPPAETAPIVAFCHLPWDGVWQRPQQLLSRLAARHPVLFVECYCADVEQATLRSHGAPGHPNVTVLQMLLPQARWADGDFIDAERRRLLQTFRRGDLGKFNDPVLWFNDPMAVIAFAGHCGERAIVYDCMDELAQFAGAPPQLRDRERELLLKADVVFCGGRKMRDKRKPYNAHCYFYGTGVDSEHFGQARSESLAVDPAVAALPGKVLGYFGVIDERIDYELLARLADALSRCSIALVGPTAKVDAAALPQRKNLHWLGRRDYADLPAITKGFSVCLMPFARNAATEFINPTKALEYMATGRPIVATAIDEVRTNFGNVCRIARSVGEFIAFCSDELERPSRLRVRRGLQLAAQNTWEAITAEMDALLVAACARRAGVKTLSPAAAPAPLAARRLSHV
ncbi:MAG: glycosyltransferase [Opitutae bacterium]|nr:glycosyltransferase [Opitutae bacterium]